MQRYTVGYNSARNHDIYVRCGPPAPPASRNHLLVTRTPLTVPSLQEVVVHSTAHQLT